MKKSDSENNLMASRLPPQGLAIGCPLLYDISKAAGDSTEWSIGLASR
jgi:hypothetical protein